MLFAVLALAATPTLSGLFADTGATRLRCAIPHTKEAFEMTADGEITGSLTYGDNTIRQLSLGESMFMTWGEEGNYTLVLNDLAGLSSEGEADAKIIFNDEEFLVKPLKCTLHSR
jgi:hypothetical protein